jgi:L-aspartate oxidase
VVGAEAVAASVGEAPPGRNRPAFAVNIPPVADPEPIRPVLSRAAGVLRTHEGLAAAIETLLPLAESDCAAADPAMVAMLIAVAALRRCESRGGHFRTDFPAPDETYRHRSTLTLDAALRDARAVADALHEPGREERCLACAK